MAIIFSESSNLNNTVYGKAELPVRMFLEKRNEEFEKNSMLKSLFVMGTSENFGDLYTGMTAMQGFEPVGENGAHPEDSMQEGYQKMLIYETWKDRFSISREIIEDGKMMDLKGKPTAFITGYHRTRERFGAALYGSAMAGLSEMKFGRTQKKFDLKTADGVTMFHTAHAGKVKKHNQSNKFSNAFSADNLGKIETAMQNFTDEDGNILDVSPDTIVIPNYAGIKKDVFAAVGADKDPATSNNAFNYHFCRWNVIVWPYLNQFVADGATVPYILLDSHYNETYHGAVWNDRVPLTVDAFEDRNTDAAVWNGRARFNACFNDWRFAAVGGVTGGSAL